MDSFATPAIFTNIGQEAFASRFRKAYLIALIIELLVVTGFYLGTAGGDWESATRVAVVFSLIICFIHLLYRLLCKNKNYLSPDLLYVIFYSAFHLGYLVIWLFGIVPETTFTFYYRAEFPKTMFIVNLGLIGFLFGYELAAARQESRPEFEVVNFPTQAWPIAGILMMIMALLIQVVYINIVGMQTFLLHGYDVFINMKDYVSNDRLWQLQPNIFALGFTIYIVSVAISKQKLFAGKIGILLFSIQACLLTLEGARTSLISLLLILILCYNYFIKRVALKWLIILGVMCMFLFASMAIVRNVTSFDITRAVQELKSAKASGSLNWYDPIVEMGGSVRTINMTAAIVPGEQPYWYGRSYVQSITHIIPFLQTFLLRNLGATPAQWLTFTIFGRFSSGTGFSIAGEGYLNFGFPGVFLQMVFIGVLLRRIFVGFSRIISPSRSLVFLASLGLFLTAVRGHTNLIFAALAQIIVLSWFMKKICGEQNLPLESNEESEQNICEVEDDDQR
jgi:oligosaccharide repeat unit polymerase